MSEFDCQQHHKFLRLFAVNDAAICSFVYSLVAATLLLTGCSGSSDGLVRSAISGSVTLDGTPLAEGEIRFVPDKTDDGKTATGQVAQATILDGKYSLSNSEGPVVGTSKVMIFANKKTGKMLEMEGVKFEEMLQYLPSKYNTDTTLSIKVKADVANTANFSLASH